MTDEDALLAAIRERPHDHTPRLVLADWYDDHDMPHEALYHRGVVASRQAAEATERVLETPHRSADIGHEEKEIADETSWRTAEARQLVGDDLASFHDQWDPQPARPHAAAEQHGTVATLHRWLAKKIADPRLSRQHSDAAEAHEAARDAFTGFGGVHIGGAFREYGGLARRPVRVVDVQAHTDYSTGKMTPAVYYERTNRPRNDQIYPDRHLHPTEFHRLHEPVTK